MTLKLVPKIKPNLIHFLWIKTKTFNGNPPKQNYHSAMVYTSNQHMWVSLEIPVEELNFIFDLMKYQITFQT
jgi:hypothetical protein